MFGEAEWWAITLSTFAGLSTAVGGAIAVIKRPDDSLLAFLLGTAIGVMFILSAVEMWIHNAMENGWASITAAVLVGVLVYQCLQPLLPDFNGDHHTSSISTSTSTSISGATDGCTSLPSNPIRRSPRLASKHSITNDPSLSLKPAELLRLGLLMAVTMTLHNLPEGCAVAFASFTDFGPMMALAIALHNIPEGIVVAAPVYAATGSRTKAIGLAVASGLSEPLGALLALVAIRPFLTEQRLQYVLAVVGGIMIAVCGLELWPEARKCRSDDRLLMGIACGAGLMGWTLWFGI